MKRLLEPTLVSDLTPEECELAFSRLDAETKRRALTHVFSVQGANRPDHLDDHGLNVQSATEASVSLYANPQLLKDVVRIIAGYLDLTSWGRLRSSCTTFRRQLQFHPDLQRIQQFLSQFSPTTPGDHGLFEWRYLCRQFFCVSAVRFIRFCHAKMEAHIASFVPTVKVITRDDGTQVTLTEKTPSNFLLNEALAEARQLSSGWLGSGRNTRWVTVGDSNTPTARIQIRYPWGFVCKQDGKRPHGSIFFPDEWDDVVGINKWNQLELVPFNKMSRVRQDLFKVQTAQHKYLFNK